jgi:hypothetical protein
VVHFFNKGTEKFPPYDLLFTRAITAIKTFFDKLLPMCIYHGEIVARKRHNVVEYDRVPRFNFILYDFQTASGAYQSHNIMIKEAKRIGFEHVPILWDNAVQGDENVLPDQKIAEIISLMETGQWSSYLGGQPEGVVLKHSHYLKKNKTTATKFKSVCKIFKEQQIVKKEKALPLEPNDLIKEIVSWYPQEAWWRKAYQRLRDDGVVHEGDDIEQRRRDFGKIVEQIKSDFTQEHGDQIKELLWAALGPLILKSVTSGASQWYTGYDPEDPKYDPNWADGYDVRQPWM